MAWHLTVLTLTGALAVVPGRHYANGQRTAHNMICRPACAERGGALALRLQGARGPAWMALSGWHLDVIHCDATYHAWRCAAEKHWQVLKGSWSLLLLPQVLLSESVELLQQTLHKRQARLM